MKRGELCFGFALVFSRRNADLLLCTTGIAQTTLDESDEEEDE